MAFISLHLANKLRPKHFDAIIGQDLAVRMLKNILYRSYFVPVYLFSGMHGCGKTSTARVFASALNCHALEAFQKNPKATSLPCLSCPSCRAMQEGRHPDFIEIDAASHTGVDNIRQLIDTAQLLPVMGNKKIYLIDEVHMLSKAAFNALLKILEEPPRDTFFILVTTDVHKVIDTVKSRCFHILFQSFTTVSIAQYLETICNSDSIVYDHQALAVIARHAQGALRDALLLLDKIIAGASEVTYHNTLHIVGYPPLEALLTIISLTTNGDVSCLIAHLCHHTILDQHDPVALWQECAQILSALMYVKNGCTHPEYARDQDQIQHTVNTIEYNALVFMVKTWYLQEEAFYKSKNQKHFLYTTLLYICMELIPDEHIVAQKKESIPLPNSKTEKKSSTRLNETIEATVYVDPVKTEIPLTQPPDATQAHLSNNRQNETILSAAIEILENKDERFLASALAQAQCTMVPNNENTYALTITLPASFDFTRVIFEQKRDFLTTVIQEITQKSVFITFAYDGPSTSHEVTNSTKISALHQKKSGKEGTKHEEIKADKNKHKKNRESHESPPPKGIVDASAAQDEHVRMVLNYFPGVVNNKK